MLAIRMQRTGRKGHAQFRMVVQDSRFSPSSGRVVTFLGSYDPHTKTVSLDKEKTEKYLANGAQPTDRVVRILSAEGVKLPEWVSTSAQGKRTVKNPEKLRRNRPAEAPEETPAAEAETVSEEQSTEAAETVEETTTNEAVATETTEEVKPVEAAEETAA